MEIANRSGEDNPQSAVKDALEYLDFGWWLLPCQWRQGAERKRPLIDGGFVAASNNPARIEEWWRHWPSALIGVATGQSGLAVLDVDIKDPVKYGPDSLDELGRSILDDTWIAHTASGGFHVYYRRGDLEIPASHGKLGPGLDVLGLTGYVIAPSPDSGYIWDPHKNPHTVPLAQAPHLVDPAIAEGHPAKEASAPVRRALALRRRGDRARLPGDPQGAQRATA